MRIAAVLVTSAAAMTAAVLHFTGHLPHHGMEIVGGLALLDCALVMSLPSGKPKS